MSTSVASISCSWSTVRDMIREDLFKAKGCDVLLIEIWDWLKNGMVSLFLATVDKDKDITCMWSSSFSTSSSSLCRSSKWDAVSALNKLTGFEWETAVVNENEDECEYRFGSFLISMRLSSSPSSSSSWSSSLVSICLCSWFVREEVAASCFELAEIFDLIVVNCAGFNKKF